MAMDKPLHSIAYTAAFLAQAKGEGMTEAEFRALEDMLAVNPSAGAMIVGSGGCRKVRLAKTGGGKSGGYRVVTFFAVESLPVYLIAVLAKGSRANFSQAEVNAMSVLAAKLIAAGQIKV